METLRRYVDKTDFDKFETDLYKYLKTERGTTESDMFVSIFRCIKNIQEILEGVNYHNLDPNEIQENPQVVYLLEPNSYSDDPMYGIFSTKENAEKAIVDICKHNNNADYENFNITEVLLDDYITGAR